MRSAHQSQAPGDQAGQDRQGDPANAPRAPGRTLDGEPGRQVHQAPHRLPFPPAWTAWPGFAWCLACTWSARSTSTGRASRSAASAT